MTQYDLKHLTHESTAIFGPIQDDEALFLFSLIRCMGLKYIVEVGGLHGYSARNFIKAINNDGLVVTIDPYFTNWHEINKILTPQLKKNHHSIIKYAHNVSKVDLSIIPRIDLLFFDAHDYESQFQFFQNCIDFGLITTKTVIVLHDTGTHTKPGGDNSIELSNVSENSNYGFFSPGLVAERKLANNLVDMGYHAIHISANNLDLPEYIEYRHGLTLLYKPYKLLLH